MTRLRPTHETRKHGIKVARGPLATIYMCPHCKHVERFPNGLRGPGRGHGLRNGALCWNAMIRHLYDLHPDQVKKGRNVRPDTA